MNIPQIITKQERLARKLVKEKIFLNKMHIFTQEQLETEAKSKPQGWLDEIISASTNTTDGKISVPEQIYNDLNIKYRLPSLLQKIKNLAKSAGEAAATGLDVRGEEETERVLSICAVCPLFVVENMACGSCGCNMQIKTKFKNFRCPLGKW